VRRKKEDSPAQDSRGAAIRQARRFALLVEFMAEARVMLTRRRWTRRGKPASGGSEAARLRKEQNRMAKGTASLRRFVQDMERAPELRPPPRTMRRSDHAALRRVHPR